MVFPTFWSLLSHDAAGVPFLRSLLVGALISGAFYYRGRNVGLQSINIQIVTLCVVLSWIMATLIGGLPYFFYGAASPLDALFEGLSGFTTTGASVLRQFEDLPQSILLWRNMTQWLGGIGIIILMLAIFPISGGGTQLYKAEISGPIHERLTPRIQQTAAFIWKTYISLTAAQLLLLLFGGLDFFDALTLSFSTVATGGFSPYYANVGHFQGDYVKWITAIFLFLSAANLTFYHIVIIRQTLRPLTENPEFRFYIGTFLVFGALTSLLLYHHGLFTSFRTSFLEGFFHAISMLSTCGFFISDYNEWPAAARHLMLLLMFCGGCAVSTAGGITCIRIVVIIKHISAEFVRTLHPRAIVPTKVGNQVIPPQIVSSCFAFFSAYMGIFALGVVLLAFFGQDMTTAISGAAATLGNVGPGFGMIGPVEGYAAQSPGVKLIYMCLMLFGRLELFTLLALFNGAFWRR